MHPLKNPLSVPIPSKHIAQAQYYRDDFAHYEKALNGESVLPAHEWKDPLSELDKKYSPQAKITH